MARQARLLLPGVAAHLIQRGNNRSACFRTAVDYQVYLSLLRRLLEKFECELHAYCLMTNHVHLLLTPPSPGRCAGMMRELGQRYSRYFNHRYLRTGTLWEGRFRSCLVETSRYVLACYRYIELNPVRPGLVDRPEGYEWSSHAANIGRRADPMLVPHPEFLALAEEPVARFRAYADLVRQTLDPALVGELRKATNAGRRLGAGSITCPPNLSLEPVPEVRG